MPNPIYLDYAATTPLDPQVRDVMLPYLSDKWGNPSSVHQAGQTVRRALDNARDQVAESIGADAGEIYFTSGGTEADNLALLGTLLAAREKGRDYLVTTTIEHHAVLDCAHFAQNALGFHVTFVPVDTTGRVRLDALADAITDKTALVSVMHANNEIGTLQPVRAIADLAHRRGAYFHTDAVQTWGQMPIDVNALGADLLTLSAHKIYGPKGSGALFIRRGVKVTPWLHGGQQERERRAGTENAPGIVGMGEAARLLPAWREQAAARLWPLRDGFIADVQSKVPRAVLNGDPTDRLPNNVNLSFPGADGETLLLGLDMRQIAASSGSACASGSIEPSHVLLALGLPDARARSAVRFSLGRDTTTEELETVADALAQLVPRGDK